MADKIPNLGRDPHETQAWLIGSGIGSLAAAVYLLNNAKLPAANIHILDLHSGAGGGMKPFGGDVEGYFLPFDCHPHFYGGHIEGLLSLVPSKVLPGQTLLDAIHFFDKFERPPPQTTALTRALKQGEKGPEVVYTKSIDIGIRNRLALAKMMLDNEEDLGSRRIADVLDKSFFDTTFWMLWATAFALQPYHSAVEFQRHLRKYLEDIHSFNNLRTVNRTEYNLYESIILPITEYLKDEGVNFQFNTEVNDLKFHPAVDPTAVTSIELIESGTNSSIKISREDIVIATLGSTSAGAVLGTNICSPPALSLDYEAGFRDWSLWQNLAKKSPKFGDPANFLSQGLDSTIETFTTTFQGSEFMQLYERLSHDRPGTGAMVSLVDSNWSITITLPHQPVFADQGKDTNIICGYALSPTQTGHYVRKPMYECCGEEILIEVLSHLGFPIEPILASSKTVPCGMPLGTAPLLSRSIWDRPKVIPQHTSNLAFIGQFVEIADDTTLAMDYSVRGAEIAVSELMGLPLRQENVKKSLLLELFDLMI